MNDEGQSAGTSHLTSQKNLLVHAEEKMMMERNHRNICSTATVDEDESKHSCCNRAGITAATLLESRMEGVVLWDRSCQSVIRSPSSDLHQRIVFEQTETLRAPSSTVLLTNCSSGFICSELTVFIG